MKERTAAKESLRGAPSNKDASTIQCHYDCSDAYNHPTQNCTEAAVYFRDDTCTVLHPRRVYKQLIGGLTSVALEVLESTS